MHRQAALKEVVVERSADVLGHDTQRLGADTDEVLDAVVLTKHLQDLGFLEESSELFERRSILHDEPLLFVQKHIITAGRTKLLDRKPHPRVDLLEGHERKPLRDTELSQKLDFHHTGFPHHAGVAEHHGEEPY